MDAHQVEYDATGHSVAASGATRPAWRLCWMDTVDRATRSRMMGSIRAIDTRPEMTVRRYLHAAGLRFRLHGSNLPGRPDLVFAGRRLVVFVHGCFWHRHQGCRFATTPASRVEFWREKFRGNVARDELQRRELQEDDWHVIEFWECESRDELALDRLCWSILAIDGRSGGMAAPRGNRVTEPRRPGDADRTLSAAATQGQRVPSHRCRA